MYCRAMRRRAIRQFNCAFSRVEIIVVIVIIGLLVPFVTVTVRSYLVQAKQEMVTLEIVSEIARIIRALETFHTTYGRYPTNEEGILILSSPTEKLPEPPLSGELVDPWGHPYQYNIPGSKGPYEVICYGADGWEGGEGANKDISSDNCVVPAHHSQPQQEQPE